ncbi:MAG: hypothetical protein QXH11_01000 [Candidatus Caldarchaeum sp.]
MVRYVYVVLALSSSILFSLVLLLTDAELWTVAPSHAYGLMVFTFLDAVLLAAALAGWRRTADVGVFWGVGKLAVFLGDILTAPEFGTTYAEFAAYLFSLWAYDGLLASQAAITVASYIQKKR